MINLTIDGKEVAVEEGATILEAATKAGIRIPYLCYNKRLLPFGACRICVVEVEAMKGRLVTACSTPVSNGMVVKTTSPAIDKARKLVLELLLVYHPLDCPVCDKAGECDLQDLVFEYGVSECRFRDEKFSFPPDRHSPLIERNLNRCILCGSCARVCDEIVGVGELSFVGRGFEAKMTTDFDRALDCEFCGQCVDICPVGALTHKLFKFKARVWDLKTVHTICSFCGTGCTIALGVKDNTIFRSVGDENTGLNLGNLCHKGRYAYDYVHSSDRLTTPLIRKGDKLVKATWKEALKKVAEGFRQIKEKNGGKSLAGLCSDRLTNEEAYLFQKFMRVVLGSNNLDHSGGYGYWAMVKGVMPSLGYAAATNSIAEIQQADVIFAVRGNISETHPVIGYEVNSAVKRKDAQLIAASDRNIKFTHLANIPLLHKPGTEVAIINGMMNVIIKENLVDKDFVSSKTEGFEALKKSVSRYTPKYVAEITGVDKELVVKAARTYAQAQKSTILVSAGLGMSVANVEIARAAVNLALITGNLGKAGTGVNILLEKNNSQGVLDMGVTPHFLPGYQDGTDNKVREKFEQAWKARLPTESGLDALDILAQAEKGKIKGLYIIGENPVVTYPGREQTVRALGKLDFLVVQDIFLSETAQMAHVVLPALTFAEKEGTYTNVERRVQKLTQAITPDVELKSDREIIQTLSALLGYEMECGTAREVMEEINELVPQYRGIKFDRLKNGGLQWPCPDTNHAGTRFLFESNSVPQKWKLFPVDYEDNLEEKSDRYPFVLLTGSVLFHSGSLSLKASGPLNVSPENFVEINPQDAEKLKLSDGDTVSVTSKRGEIRLKAKVTDKSLPGTVFIPYHFSEPSVNSLTDKSLKYTKVRIKRVAS